MLDVELQESERFRLGALLAIIGTFCSMHIPRVTLPICVFIYVVVFIFMIEWDI